MDETSFSRDSFSMMDDNNNNNGSHLIYGVCFCFDDIGVAVQKFLTPEEYTNMPDPDLKRAQRIMEAEKFDSPYKTCPLCSSKLKNEYRKNVSPKKLSSCTSCHWRSNIFDEKEFALRKLKQCGLPDNKKFYYCCCNPLADKPELVYAFYDQLDQICDRVHTSRVMRMRTVDLPFMCKSEPDGEPFTDAFPSIPDSEL